MSKKREAALKSLHRAAALYRKANANLRRAEARFKRAADKVNVIDYGEKLRGIA